MRIFLSDAARLRYSMVFEYYDGHAPAARARGCDAVTPYRNP